MVSLFLGDRANLVGKIQGCFEVGKFEFPFDVVTIDNMPTRDFSGERLDLVGGKRRHPSSTWNACFLGKSCHTSSSENVTADHSISSCAFLPGGGKTESISFRSSSVKSQPVPPAFSRT